MEGRSMTMVLAEKTLIRLFIKEEFHYAKNENQQSSSKNVSKKQEQDS